MRCADAMTNGLHAVCAGTANDLEQADDQGRTRRSGANPIFGGGPPGNFWFCNHLRFVLPPLVPPVATLRAYFLFFRCFFPFSVISNTYLGSLVLYMCRVGRTAPFPILSWSYCIPVFSCRIQN